MYDPTLIQAALLANSAVTNAKQLRSAAKRTGGMKKRPYRARGRKKR